ncbi:MAG: hypothetical protein IPN68_19720 [Bacteroidetes bacterium]|nr:hypothetical protein [Bacteroidota bacterium]
MVVLLLLLTFTASTGSPDIYSIDYDPAANGAGYIDRTDIAFGASPINLVIPGAAPVTTYSGSFTVKNSTTGCTSLTHLVNITVTATSTISLSSAAGTDDQSICITSAIEDITYNTTGAIGATFSGLPAGVTGSWAGNVVTISGTPTTANTYNYIVNLSGGCGTVSASGKIVVNPVNTMTLNSGSLNQTKCINTPIDLIEYSTTGATGATFSGLPIGVNGTWAADVLTVSGTPTESGVFNYTITLTGGCGTISKNGTLTINPDMTLTLSSGVSTE